MFRCLGRPPSELGTVIAASVNAFAASVEMPWAPNAVPTGTPVQTVAIARAGVPLGVKSIVSPLPVPRR
jgi:hypothetical protein